jgi:hypothetical protein
MVSSGREGSFSSGGALRAEIPIKRVDGGVQNQVAIRASFQMPLDLSLYGRG